MEWPVVILVTIWLLQLFDCSGCRKEEKVPATSSETVRRRDD